MSHLTPIIFILLAVRNTEAAVTPVVTLSTNWSYVYSGDQVTLSCNVGPEDRNNHRSSYIWYKDDKLYNNKKSEISFTAQVQHSGVYKCSVGSGIYSNPVQLHVISGDNLILQTPPDIVEGDSPSLRCRSMDKDDNKIYYYKNNEWINIGNTLQIPNVTTAETGRYECGKYIHTQWRTAETYITVQDLFTTPKIEIIIAPLREGDDMTVRCDTRLNPLRGGTELHFSFYRDGRTVQDFSVSDTYRVRSAQVEDSGNYTCEVRTASDTVRKMSDELSIEIQRAAVRPVVTLSPNWNHFYRGDSVTLSCSVESVVVNSYWYKGERIMDWNKQKKIDVKVTANEMYRCSTDKTFYSHPVRLGVIENGKPDRPVVTFSPHWGTVFENEMINMTCNTTKPTQNYGWIKDGNPIRRASNQKFQIKSSNIKDSGDYQCISGRDRSSSVRLEVNNNASVILQAPPDVIEGDSFDLKCHSLPGYEKEVMTLFYKDNEQLESINDILHIQDVNTAMSGIYKCKKNIYFDPQNDIWIWAETYISVQDLFTTPKLDYDRYPIQEGGDMTLTCNTRHNPLRENTNLKFAFYREGQIVKDFSEDETFSTRGAQMKDSGNYTCEVRTESDTVRKNSNVVSILIREVFTSPQISVKPSLPVREGQQVTIECASETKVSTSLVYTFYKDSQIIPRYYVKKSSYVINKARKDHTGTYQCSVKSGDGKFSKNSTNIYILVQSDLILQIPPDIVEGDSPSLECLSMQNYKTVKTTYFYKDNERFDSKDGILHIPNVTMAATGKYRCEKYFWDGTKWESADTYISVQELFSTPEIQTSPNSIQEGDEMTVTCHTRLHLLRGGTELHFAFYRDGRTVREFNGSDTYRVRSAQLEDSGNYTCEVRTANDTVRKDSNTSHIQVQELFTSPAIRVNPSPPVEEGGQVTLECMTDPKGSTSLLYIFYKDSQIVQSDYRKTSYVIGKAGEEHTGSYQCSVQSRDGKVRKNSTNIYILVQSVNITADQNDFVYGESLTLNCSVEKGTSPVFLWLHNEMVVNQDSEFYQLRDNGTVLYIESLQSHHVGTYRCQVSNKLSDSNYFFVLKTFQISQISENPPLGRNIIWPVLGVLMLTLLIIIILLFVKRRKLSSLFLSLNRQQNQQNSESTFDKDRPRDDGRSANEGTNGPNETDNQHLYGNVSLQEEEDDICYTYIDISKIQGPTNTKDEPCVVYSVLQPPGASMGSQATQETDDSANIYQNFNAEQH